MDLNDEVDLMYGENVVGGMSPKWVVQTDLCHQVIVFSCISRISPVYQTFIGHRDWGREGIKITATIVAPTLDFPYLLLKCICGK